MTNIQADQVTMEMSSAQNVQATDVTVNRSGVFQVDAQTVNISDAVAAVVNAEYVDLKDAGAMLVRSASATLKDRAVGVLYGGSIELHNSQAQAIVARQVTAPSIRTGVLLASKVEGNVEAVLDTPRALLAGLAAGVAFGLVSVIGKIIRGRR